MIWVIAAWFSVIKCVMCEQSYGISTKDVYITGNTKVHIMNGETLLANWSCCQSDSLALVWLLLLHLQKCLLQQTVATWSGVKISGAGGNVNPFAPWFLCHCTVYSYWNYSTVKWTFVYDMNSEPFSSGSLSCGWRYQRRAIIWAQLAWARLLPLRCATTAVIICYGINIACIIFTFRDDREST